MEHQDYLNLVAELAVAFAGFTGIVAAFRFRGTSLNAAEMGNFSTMLRASISALFLSLLPYLLHQFINNSDVAWRGAAAAVFIVMAINISRSIKTGSVNYTPIGRYVLFPMGVLAALLNLLAVFDLLKASDMVILAISFQLIISAYNFATLIIQAPLTQHDAN